MSMGWYAGALVLLQEAVTWRRHWLAQMRCGADAPTHFEAAAARGTLDKPFFGEYQPSGPGTHWAYIGPRAILMLYWLFLPLWRWKRPVCCVAWQFFMAACTMAALGILWPAGMGIGAWCLPLLALILWSSEDTGALGASNPVALLLLALALKAGGPVAAGAWFGAAVALRVWPLAFAPLMLYAHPGAFACLQMAASALGVGVVLTAAAWGFGFGYDSPRKIWRLFVALQTGPIKKLVALHKRRPYFLLLAPFMAYPNMAIVAGVAGLVYACCFLNVKRWAQETPLDIAFVWYNDWNGKDVKM